MSGAVNMAFGVCGAGMGYGGGRLIAALGCRELFLIAGGLTAAGTLLFWAQSRVRREPQTAPERAA